MLHLSVVQLSTSIPWQCSSLKGKRGSKVPVWELATSSIYIYIYTICRVRIFFKDVPLLSKLEPQSFSYQKPDTVIQCLQLNYSLQPARIWASWQWDVCLKYLYKHNVECASRKWIISWTSSIKYANACHVFGDSKLGPNGSDPSGFLCSQPTCRDTFCCVYMFSSDLVLCDRSYTSAKLNIVLFYLLSFFFFFSSEAAFKLRVSVIYKSIVVYRRIYRWEWKTALSVLWFVLQQVSSVYISLAQTNIKLIFFFQAEPKADIKKHLLDQLCVH